MHAFDVGLPVMPGDVKYGVCVCVCDRIKIATKLKFIERKKQTYLL